MSIKLYMDYMSQPSRAVLSLFLFSRIPFEIVQTRVDRQQTKTEQYLKINPMGRVPAIVDPSTNLNLAESHAIMRYLCRKYPDKATKWYASNNYLKQAKIDQYLDFHHSNTRKCHYYLFNEVFVKKFGLVGDRQFNEENTKKEITMNLKIIQEHYLADNQYIAGNQPSIADLSAFFQIEFLTLAGEDFGKWPIICKWLKRMIAKDEIKETNKIFEKIKPKIAPKQKKSVF